MGPQVGEHVGYLAVLLVQPIGRQGHDVPPCGQTDDVNDSMVAECYEVASPLTNVIRAYACSARLHLYASLPACEFNSIQFNSIL